MAIKATVGNVRSEPSPSGTVQFQVRQGEMLLLLDVAGDWYHVEARNGKRGYIYKNLAEIVEPPPPPAEPAAATPPPPPQSLIAIDHKEVGCVVANQYPKLDACLVPDAGVGRAQIHFRALSTDPWYAVELKPDGPCFSAFLPKPQATTPQIEYYLDVIDKDFTEVARPEAAPGQSYRVRVVKKERDCESTLKRMAFSVAKSARPIVVSVVRDAAGKVLDQMAAKAFESHLLLNGFSSQGVIVSSTGAAPGAATAASGTSGAAAGAAGAGGGIGLGTLAVVGGVAAAGAVAAAAKGGGGGPGASGSQPGTSTPTSLTGQWAGPWHTVQVLDIDVRPVGGSGILTETITCDYQTTMDLAQSGTSFTGTSRSTGSCTTTCSGANASICTDPRLPTPIAGTTPVDSTGPLNGTVSGSQLTFVVPDAEVAGVSCAGYNIPGTFTATTMGGAFDVTTTCSNGQSARYSGTWSATRR